MIVSGVLSAIGSGSFNNYAGWGWVDSIEIKGAAELRKVSLSRYLDDKLQGCLGQEVSLLVIDNAVLGIKRIDNLYLEEAGFKSVANAWGVGKLILFGVSIFSVYGAPIGLYLYLKKKNEIVKLISQFRAFGSCSA